MVGTIGGMKKRPITRIGPKRPRKIYVKEWRKKRGLTQETLGQRMGVEGITVSRWERGTRKPPVAALAEAFDIEPEDLYRDPDTPSADALLRDMTESQRRQAIAIIEAMRKTGT